MAKESRKQRTIAREVELSGTGVHTGRTATLRICPAPPGAGLLFRRTDLPGTPEIPARLENVLVDCMDRRTTIGLDRKCSVATVEHLLAVCVGLKLDNAVFEVDAPEMPFFDGSAEPIAHAILRTGVVKQTARIDYLDLDRPLIFDRYPVQMTALPAPRLRLSYFVEFDSKVIGNQAAHVSVTTKQFLKKVAPARTFCFLRDVERLQKKGLIRGGTLDCAVVIDEDRILNDELRFKDEIVRHKLIDLLGDIALLGQPLRAHLTAWRAGHAWHIEFLKQLKEELSNEPV